MSEYKVVSATSAAVCDVIGWAYKIHPIETCRRGDVVYVRGTLLHPDEWLQLRGWHGHKCTIDGRTVELRVTGLPPEIARA